MEELRGRYVLHFLEVIAVTLLLEQAGFAECAEAILHHAIRKGPEGVVRVSDPARLRNVGTDRVVRENDPAPPFLIDLHQKAQHRVLGGRSAVPFELAGHVELIGPVDQQHQGKA